MVSSAKSGGCRSDHPVCAFRRILPSSASLCEEGNASELQLQRELDLPRGRGGIYNDPARGAVLVALENHFVRVREIGVIQNIERLGTELQIQSLTDSHPFQERS